MTVRQRIVGRLALAVVVGVLVATAPLGKPAEHGDPFTALCVGAVTAVLVFALLARRARPLPVRQRAVARALALALPLLVLGAIAEELLWRAIVVGITIEVLGAVGAVALSATAFAIAHLHRGWSVVRTHVFTGMAFGIVYVATGRIVAAILSHLLYNLLVVAAAVAWTQQPAPA